MSEIWQKHREDLNRLIREGQQLYYAIQFEHDPEGFKEGASGEIGEEATRTLVDDLPYFKEDYQVWYSEALALIKQVLPERVKDFTSFYECPRGRKAITIQNYVIRDYLQGFKITQSHDSSVIAPANPAVYEFYQQLSIVKAAKLALDSSLINLTTILQADLFDSEVESARELKKAGFLRASGAICGVVVEKHLKQMCANRQIVIRKTKPTLSDLNELLKKNDVISTVEWRFIQRLFDIRNICCHDSEHEPTKQNLDDLLDGTSKILKTLHSTD